MSYEFTDRMETGKANALRDRNRGGGNGCKVYRTTEALYASRGGTDETSPEHALHLEQARRMSIVADMWEDFRRAVYPERYEEIEL